MNADRPVLGIMLMIGFCALAPLGDSIAKILGATIPLIQLLAVRFAIQALLLVPLVWYNGSSMAMDRRILMLTGLRTILHIMGIGAMFSALRFLEVADALAIAFVMPFILLVLGRFYLDEEIGIRRLSACAAGFCGTLLIIQPRFASIGPPALLPLFVAFSFALFMIVTRKIAKTADPVTIQAVSGVQATAILAAVMLAGAGSGLAPLNVVMPVSGEWLLLAAIGVIGTLAHLLMTWSLRFAPSATLAPMQYLEIPFATLIGWIIFGYIPEGKIALGICITMAAGLYVVWRERATAQPVPPET